MLQNSTIHELALSGISGGEAKTKTVSVVLVKISLLVKKQARIGHF